MSTTLGEKLRQAREERGTSVSEVAAQTRISALYIQSIENDDYRTLPGGIFNKGFVKSFARCVGIDEQEALQDYAALMGSQNVQNVDEPKTYRPQVMTDDNNSSSLKTILFAVLIVGFIVGGILAAKKYLESRQTETAVVNANVAANVNADTANATNEANSNTAPAATPSMNDLRVEMKSLKGKVSVSSTSDGARSNAELSPEKPLNFAPKESLRLSYYKAFAQNVRLTLNGREISLPAAPVNPKRNVVEMEINKDNLAVILRDGKISAVETTPSVQR